MEKRADIGGATVVGTFSSVKRIRKNSSPRGGGFTFVRKVTLFKLVPGMARMAVERLRRNKGFISSAQHVQNVRRNKPVHNETERLVTRARAITLSYKVQ